MKMCKFKGIGLISVGHRPSLAAYHDKKLIVSTFRMHLSDFVLSQLGKDGSARVETVSEDEKKSSLTEGKQAGMVQSLRNCCRTSFLLRVGRGARSSCVRTATLIFVELL